MGLWFVNAKEKHITLNSTNNQDGCISREFDVVVSIEGHSINTSSYQIQYNCAANRASTVTQQMLITIKTFKHHHDDHLLTALERSMLQMLASRKMTKSNLKILTFYQDHFILHVSKCTDHIL